VLIVGITSNRGLCGGFNNNVIKKVNSLVNIEYKDANPRVLCLGKKIKDVYKRTDHYFINDAIAPVEDIFGDLSFDNSAVIGSELMRLFETKQFDKIIVVYNSFVNAASQNIEAEQFLPIVPVVQENASSGDYIFEPGKSEIVNDLIPKSLKVQLFKGLLDSHASEHGARMTAMHKATDNANDLKKSLTLSYNKARQAAITNEILEIVGGAEALNG
jgi:F-type H+-transporting ATPase subunit gamma